MKNTTKFRALSTTDMAAFYSLVAAQYAPDVPTVEDFDTKAKGVAKTSALLREAGLELVVSDEGDFSVEPIEVITADGSVPEADAADEADGSAPEGDEAADVGSGEEAADEAVEAMPFVKLPKDQLAPRGTPEREAYRKARRAAARAARKATLAA